MSRIVLRTALVFALSVAALSTGSVQADTVNCFDRQSIYAKLLQPSGGQVSATTQAGVVTYSLPITIDPTPPTVFVSSTGEIEVKIEHQCLRTLRLTVHKDGNPVAIYDQTWEKPCDHAIHTVMVPIGLDAGTFQFQASGVSCSGLPVTPDGRGGVVGDPPLPISL